MAERWSAGPARCKLRPACSATLSPTSRRRASGLRRAYAPPRWAGIAAAIALMFGAGAGWTGAQMNAQPEDDVMYANAFSVLSETQTLFEDAS